MKQFFSLSVLLFLYCQSFAQQKDSVLKDQTIEVIQSYKPQVKQAPKPRFQPDLPPKDNTSPAFQYDVPQQVLYYSYTPPPLRPLVFGKDSSSLPYPGYIKLGGGNLSTIYLDAGIASFNGENYQTALHVHHIQQQGRFKYQKTAFSGLEATGELTTKKLHYKGGIDILRNQYYNYGAFVDTGVAPAKNTYTGITLSVAASNELQNKAGIDYNPSLKAGVYGRKDNSEKWADVSLPASKKLNEEFTINAALNLQLAHVTFANNSTINNNTLQFVPNITYEKKGFKGTVGIKPTLGIGDNSYILPDIKLSYKFDNILFKIYAGWEGSLKQNTLQQLSTYNPYLDDLYLTRQTRQYEIYGGISAGLGNNLNVDARLSHRDYENLPMFVNNFSTNAFSILYDPRVKAVSVEATLRYDIADVFSLKASGAYFNYYQYTYARVWHEPSLRFNVDFIFNVIKNLNVTAYTRVLDGIYAQNELGQETKLKAAFEIGTAGEYQIIPRLSAFLTLNNLLNNRYQRWYHYEAYGLNVFGGLRLKF